MTAMLLSLIGLRLQVLPCLVTAYYTPVTGQQHYFEGSYDSECRMEGCGRGADGTTPYMGMLAAGRNYTFGTKVYIPGHSWTTVHDRGGMIHGHHFDVWVGRGDHGYRAVRRWGTRHLTCTVLALSVRTGIH